jgi:Galactose oxidase, central domain/Kelch motif
LLKVTALVITYSGASDQHADRMAVAPQSYFFDHRPATATSTKVTTMHSASYHSFRRLSLLLLTSIFFALAGCGGGTSPVTATGPFAVSGTVTGLSPGKTVSLSNNSADLLTLSSNGAFVFSVKLASAASYRVTVSAATQNCAVTAGAGTLRDSNITGVTVTCGPGAFAEAAPLAKARYSHTATLLPDGRVLAIGGFDDTNAVATAELYDPATKAWSPAGAMGTGRYLHAATLLPNGKVLVSGGISVSTAVPTNELYDPATSTWSAAAPMIAPRFSHTATLLANGKVLVSGGLNVSTAVATAELYDPATNTWAATGSMATSRYYHTASALPNGRVVVTGGFSSAGVATAEQYDSATGTWASAGSMTFARFQHAAALLPDGKLLVSGGVNDANGKATIASAELYDASTNSWSVVGSMAQPRNRHTASVLYNGKVLVMGGVELGALGGETVLASAELYDPLSKTWSSAGAMSAPREKQTATLLTSGQVLFSGGVKVQSAVTTVELYF